MGNQTAYCTADPVVVAAYLAARDCESAFARTVIAAAAAISKNKGPLRHADVFDGGYHTVGLAADDPTDPPVGWRYTERGKMLVPRKSGKAGAAAMQWLKDHQPPEEANLRGALASHGLPLNDMTGGRFGLPEVALHDDKLWALYRGTPGLWCGDGQTQVTWGTCNLSEYYAAREAAVAADEARAAWRESVPV